MKTKPKNKGGRPRKEIDLHKLAKLCVLQPTDEEIAAFFDVSIDTIYERKKDTPGFTEAIRKGKEAGKISLRRYQWKSARSGNVSMQIWLGKQNLGQSDKVEEKNTERIEITGLFLDKERSKI